MENVNLNNNCYHLANEQGYRSHAALNLIQLDSKFSFFRSSRSGVLDLCAAPGGFMQVAVQRVPDGTLVVGIDLLPIPPIPGAISVEEDISKPQCKATIKKLMEEHECLAFDLVLLDGSSNVRGDSAQEATDQLNALFIDSVKLATEFLAPKGTFVTKVCRSQDYTTVLYCLRQLFERVEIDKYKAEVYVIGLKYKAPSKINPHLFDVRHPLQPRAEPSKTILFVVVYEVQEFVLLFSHFRCEDDGETFFTKVCSASDFVWSSNPFEILGSVTSISFEDSASSKIKNHDLTTEEVKSICVVLRVLGKQDFKLLLKWRMDIRKALSAPVVKPAPLVSADIENDKKENEEEKKMLDEMEGLTYSMEHKKTRSKKDFAKRRLKDKSRMETGIQMDGMEVQELFSLSSIKGKETLEVIDTGEDDIGDLEEMINEDNDEGSSSDLDTDEERERYDEQLEDMLEKAYGRYVVRRKRRRSNKSRQRKRLKVVEALSLKLKLGQGNDDSEEEEDDHEPNPLVVVISDSEEDTAAASKESLTPEEIMTNWFSQDIFQEEEEEEDDDGEPKSSTTMEMKRVKKHRTFTIRYVKIDERPAKKVVAGRIKKMRHATKKLEKKTTVDQLYNKKSNPNKRREFVLGRRSRGGGRSMGRKKNK
ncbi:adoMet-dependent rRNA methyltransferase SPB1-like [Impatiens glandulifera]|uniref:adoMet-dependent rRNA methyltransferase SPB1-like n=1 Tax=Impatiens glandulifera TaxID=253017 RepID=UPI001FB051B0|nr:adoMet-dependent rRNA methyltransferase SPB1-like [Impatiens glandulifera]